MPHSAGQAGPPAPRVIIVGAGFGGLYAAKRLAGTATSVTLVDQANHHLFQPLLYQVATAALSPSDIATPIRAAFTHADNVRVLMGDVTGVDVQTRTVGLRDTSVLQYDILVLATGAVTSWFGHAGWEEASSGLKSLDDALTMRRRLLGAFEWAESRDDPDEIARLMTFVVVGGGPTGVELAGSIVELARATLARDYRVICPFQARVVLCDAGDRLLASFPDHLSAYAASRLRRMGVEIRLNAPVQQVDPDGLTAGGTRIESATVFWAAGVTATPAASWIGVSPGPHGRLPVAANLSVEGHPEIFAIGDVMARSDVDGKPLPGLATVGKQQGRYVGDLIRRRVEGRHAPGPFRYRQTGSLAIIGRSAAVADFGRFSFAGLLAWLAWACIHLLLMGVRNRLVVYVTWVWSWVTWGRGARLITGLDTWLATSGGRAATTRSRVPLAGGTGVESRISDRPTLATARAPQTARDATPP